MKQSVSIVLILTALILVACSSGDDTEQSPMMVADVAVADDMATANMDAGTDEPVVVNQQALVQALADEVIEPGFAAFAVSAETLAAALTDWAQDQSDENHEAAREAWRQAMLAWQLVEVLQIGPLAKSGTRTAGADGRDRVYSWPVSNACRIDQEIVSGAFAEANWFDRALLNVQGLDALEYLLFYEEDDNSCPGAVRINRDGEWAALVAEPGRLAQQRADYATVLAASIVDEASSARDVWSASADFGRSFRDGTMPFGGYEEVLDEVFSGLFYLDKLVKDRKLGRILGLTEDCEAEACPEDAESAFAGLSTQNLIQNLRGFRLAMTGVEGQEDQTGIGFADLLEAEGAGELGERMVDNIDTAIEAIEAIGTDLATAMVDNRGSVAMAHGAIKAITDDLKGQFVTVLSLEIPAEGAGDND